MDIQEKDVISVKGKSCVVKSVHIGGKCVVRRGRLLKTAFLKDEVCDGGISDPDVIIRQLKSLGMADIFTFDQKWPDTGPLFNFFYEWDNLAAVKIESFDHWWKNQISHGERGRIRKSERSGVVTKVIPLTDQLVEEIKGIYDETPIRQGRPFWHYRKNLETIKKENSTCLERSEFIGAYLHNELIAFSKLIYTSNRADHIQLIAKVKHRDKAPTNALIAKAVEVCAEKNISFLTYGKYHYCKKVNDSLCEFKRRNGFEKIEIPRYYVPLTAKGKLAILLRLYREPMEWLPSSVSERFLTWRARYYTRKYSSPSGSL